MRDAHGNTTSEEILRGKKFGANWMCPAQRPGYTDQWLVPIYKEFAEMYDFDGIHHDYMGMAVFHEPATAQGGDVLVLQLRDERHGRSRSSSSVDPDEAVLLLHGMCRDADVERPGECRDIRTFPAPFELPSVKEAPEPVAFHSPLG